MHYLSFQLQRFFYMIPYMLWKVVMVPVVFFFLYFNKLHHGPLSLKAPLSKKTACNTIIPPAKVTGMT